MIKLTIRYSKKRVRNSGVSPECKTHSRRERPQAKTVELSEDEPISIFDIKERFVPEGYDLDHWAFSKLDLI